MHQHMNGGSYSFTGGAARPSESPPLAYSAPPQQAPPLSGYHSLPAEMPLLAQLGNLAAGSMSADQYASCMYILQQQYLLGRQQALLENRAQAGARSNDMLRAFQQIQAAPASPQCTTPSTPFMHAGAQADSTPRAAENRSTPHSGLVFNPLNLGTTSYPNLSTPPQPASEAHNLHNAGHPTRPTTLARQASAPLSSSPVQQTLHHHFTPLPALSSYSFDAISMVRIYADLTVRCSKHGPALYQLLYRLSTAAQQHRKAAVRAILCHPDPRAFADRCSQDATPPATARVSSFCMSFATLFVLSARGKTTGRKPLPHECGFTVYST